MLITPRQFGPISGMPAARTLSRSLASSAAPSCPTSLKPAEMTTSAFTPLAIASIDHAEDRRGGHDQHGQIDRAGNVGQAWDRRERRGSHVAFGFTG